MVKLMEAVARKYLSYFSELEPARPRRAFRKEKWRKSRFSKNAVNNARACSAEMDYTKTFSRFCTRIAHVDHDFVLLFRRSCSCM